MRTIIGSKKTITATAILAALDVIGATMASAATDEIVVSARKRGEENIQDVPSSIQAISGDSMQRRQIYGFDDYARIVPSLSAINQGPGQTQITLRGISSGRISHVQPQNKSTTGIYIDDVPVTANAFNPDLSMFDVERIEVLRGPQGTLYGASSMAGTIRVITKKPDLNEYEGKVGTTVSTTKSGGVNYALQGMLNIPLVADKLAVRAVGYYQDNSGFIDNIIADEEDYNNDHTAGGRIALEFRPTDALTMNFSLMYQDLHADGRPDEFLPGLAQAQTLSPVGVTAPGENLIITDELQTAKFVPDPFDDEFYIVNFAFDWDFDWATLSSSSSYMDRKFANRLDDTFRGRLNLGPVLADGMTPLVSQVVIDNTIRDIVQEIRLASPKGEKFSWLVGTYFQKQERSFVESLPLPGLEDLLSLFGLPPSSFFGAQDNSLFDGAQAIKQRQLALFGEATYALTDRLELTVGARVFDWKQDFDLYHAGLANGGVDILDESTSEDGINPKFVVSYRASDDILVYAQATKGFRLGGVNEPVPTTGLVGDACASEIAARGLGELPRTFKSDSLWNYEVGAKSSLGGRLKVNAAAYYVKWSDIQTTTFLQCGFTTIFNAGEVTSKGAEIELAASVTERLSLSFGGSFTHSVLTSSTDEGNLGVGSRTPNVPRWLVNAGFDYSAPLSSSGLEGYFRGDIQYTSNSYTEFVGGALRTEIPSHTSGNLSVGLASDHWDVSLFVKNVTDERIVAGVDTDRNVPASFTRARPRTIGIATQIRF